MQMTNRERLLAIMGHQSPDRIPWIPRLEIWYAARQQQDNLPERFKGLTLREVEHALGVGTPARAGRVFRTTMRNVEVRTQTEGESAITRYITPVGTVQSRRRHSETLLRGGIVSPLDTEHLIKGPEDYRTVAYMVEHTDVTAAYEDYLAYEDEIGDDGYPLVAMGPDPIYRIIQDYVGYNAAFYHLVDYRREVLYLYEVLKAYMAQVQQIVLDSPARLILHGEHFDSQMTPPRLFREFMLPYFQPFAERMHAAGKTLVCHADADTSRLLELILEAGFDMAECFVTAPMVPVTLARARAAWGTDIIIWGGIPSALLCDPVTEAEFEAYVQDLFHTIAPGDAFILGAADNVMAEARLERIERITALVNAQGALPIESA